MNPQEFSFFKKDPKTILEIKNRKNHAEKLIDDFLLTKKREARMKQSKNITISTSESRRLLNEYKEMVKNSERTKFRVIDIMDVK